MDEETTVYEHHKEPLASRAVFLRRLASHAALALVVVLISLGLGMAGYHAYEGLSWLDAFLNAAMLLGGMGPVNVPQTPAGKLFAGLYALYAGLVFLAVLGVMLLPILHRFLHRFHLVTEQAEEAEEEQEEAGATRHP
jgi:hypothetical protein